MARHSARASGAEGGTAGGAERAAVTGGAAERTGAGPEGPASDDADGADGHADRPIAATANAAASARNDRRIDGLGVGLREDFLGHVLGGELALHLVELARRVIEPVGQ